MSLFKNLQGIVGDYFRVGLFGFRLKNNSGVLEVKDASDSAFVVARGADPVVDDDLVTKRYSDLFKAGLKTLVVPFDYTAVGFVSSFSIPVGSTVYSVRVEIDVAFQASTAVNAYLIDDSAYSLVGVTDVRPSIISAVDIDLDHLLAAGSRVQVDVANPGSVGSGRVVVFFLEFGPSAPSGVASGKVIAINMIMGR